MEDDIGGFYQSVASARVREVAVDRDDSQCFQAIRVFAAADQRTHSASLPHELAQQKLAEKPRAAGDRRVHKERLRKARGIQRGTRFR